jgi:hypothetical protein
MPDDPLADQTRQQSPIPPCPGCGSAPAATDVDDICPKCGAYNFLCGLVTHIPLSDAPPIHQQVTKPRWVRIPPSQVKRPKSATPFVPPEHGDPSRCPGCKVPVPDQYATLPTVTCQACGRWELHTGLAVMPAAGPQGTPPSVVRLHAPLWRPIPPQTVNSRSPEKGMETVHDKLLSALAEMQQYLIENPATEYSQRLRELDAHVEHHATRLQLQFPSADFVPGDSRSKVGFCQIPCDHGIIGVMWQQMYGLGDGVNRWRWAPVPVWWRSFERFVELVKVAKQNIGDALTEREKTPTARAKKNAKKKRSGPKRNREPRTVTLLLVLLEDRTNANLNLTELAERLRVSVSSVSRAFHHVKYGPILKKRYGDYGVRPPRIREI